VGSIDGDTVGQAVDGESEGSPVGAVTVGSVDGDNVGIEVTGEGVGSSVGVAVGSLLGDDVGIDVAGMYTAVGGGLNGPPNVVMVVSGGWYGADVVSAMPTQPQPQPGTNHGSRPSTWH